MTLDDLLKPEKERRAVQDELIGTQYAEEGLHYLEFFRFIQDQGIDNISVKDMNKLIQRYGNGIMGIEGFMDYYSIISSNESNKALVRWTRWIGRMTVVMLIGTIVSLCK